MQIIGVENSSGETREEEKQNYVGLKMARCIKKNWNGTGFLQSPCSGNIGSISRIAEDGQYCFVDVFYVSDTKLEDQKLSFLL